ncbi:unnamed protein product [Amaranthus hypochondriacus]
MHQPIGKGGNVLMNFLGNIAKRDAYCPIELKNWHELRNSSKAEILKLVRQHFLLPEGAAYDSAILKRVGKVWRQHRYSLKRNNFDQTLSKDDNYAKCPIGIKRLTWEALVDYWLSSDGLKYSKIGKQARVSHAHSHTSGATSFANRRAVFEKSKESISELKFYETVYTKKDGSFKEGTISGHFMEKAKAKVDEQLASSSKSQVEIENSVFNDLMYGEKTPKRPLNYGFGVKQSDVFGPQSLVSRERHEEANNLNVEMESLRAENRAILASFKSVTSGFAEVLKAIRNGNVSSQILDLAESTLNANNHEIIGA